ncbi:hypothetical protein [Bosea sp. (in: a-proteobacteria)]|uniref:DUF805 domain-containing protein n=1 Tax=Bosea sp. (in: a-proteobacteria) TaxID=1871050 RepID=UPI0026356AEE|nr:hypothetical protein [Bosea sp. (in: a-proteobacteria)]MCO5091624.1 hypothetical protein [Bosea sp. (in: a-proteobacteria)]
MSLIRLFSDFDGRIGLRAFWLGSIAVALVLLAIQHAAPLLADRHDAAMIIAFTKAFALFPWAALAAKRANDRGSAPLFGILLIGAIVLPEQLRPLVSFGWRPSLEAIATMAWVVALIDLGLMPSAGRNGVAAAPAGAKAAE